MQDRILELTSQVGRDPGDRAAFVELGELYHALREFESAVTSYRSALAIEQDARCWNSLGRSLNNLRDLSAAEDAFSNAVQLDPASAEMHNNLGHVRRAKRDLAGAEQAFRAAIDADPHFGRAHHNLATVLNSTGRFDDAIASFRAGLKCNPHDPQGLTNLGDMLYFCQEYKQAEDAYRNAIACDPLYVDAWGALGWLYQNRRRLDEAQEAFGEALRIMPGHSVALAGVAAISEINGDYVAGCELLQPLVASGRATPELEVAYARLLRHLDRKNEALEIIEKVVAQATDESAVPPAVFYSLGDMYDETGDYDAAFAAYKKGNDLVPSGFDPESHRRGIDAIIDFYDPSALKQLPRSSMVRQTPVFVVGMPRSGTSLVEQILASHPQVHAAGERIELYHMAKNMRRFLGAAFDYPQCLTSITSEQLDELATQYYESLGQLDSEITCVTDKLPANFLLVGLIELLFPDARIIHCTRNPMDSGLSCYFQNFNSRGLAFSRDLEHIAAYYNEYMRLMTHWRGVSGIPILDLPYADLVADVEPWSRRLIEFAGLPWDDRCLKFYSIDRVVNTASFAQVRKPIYATSVNKYRFYEKHLGPLSDALRDDICDGVS